MPFTTVPAAPILGMTWWVWLAVSVVPDALLVVSLIILWRHFVVGRRQARHSLQWTSDELSRNADTLWMATELADVGVWSWDLVSGSLTWSDRCKAHFGLSPREPVDIDRFYVALHPDDRDRVRAEIERSRTERKEFRTRYRAMLPDGSQRELAAMGRFSYDASGKPLFMGGVTLDVSRLMELESELQTAEAVAEQQEVERHRLRAMIMSSLNPVTLTEPVRDASGKTVDFTYVDFNQAACDFIGLDREHLLGRRLVDLFPQLKATGLLARFSETADTGRLLSVDDFPFPMEGGAIHNIDVRAVRIDEWVVFHWRDNSERYEALQRITASEERFRLLAENSLDVVVRLDANDKVVWVSPSVATVLGWSVAEVVGRSGLDFLATEETRQQYRRDKARVFAGEGTVSRSQIRSKAGEVHWMEAHSSPFRMPDGRIDGVIAAMRLVDAEVLAEQALERRARIDDLTGLLNRKELMDRLEGLVARGERDFAVLWCDIDRFKETNDVHGHAADPSPFEGGTLVATLSIGVTLALPDEGVDAILARADDAMYQAKEQGRNRVVVLPVAPS